jgi:Protein of unknown function (DUF5818)
MKLLLASLLAIASLGAAPADETFVGTISDDMCAMNHAVMRMGPTDAECTRACVEEHDAAYVLVDGQHVYRLTDQRAPKAFAGRRAKVTGTLDAATGTIAVTSVTAP